MPSPFREIIDKICIEHWNNVLKLPKLARDPKGNYYLKEVE